MAHAADSVDPAPLAALLASVAEGDRAALGRLYDLTISRVYGLSLRIARKPEAAEEIAGDVYLQVWRNAARYDAARGHPLAWLLVIARSRALDHLRRADEAEPHPDPQVLADYAETADDPHNLVAATRAHSALNAALTRLPAVQRQLLSLAYFRGLSHSEIALHTGMPLGTVKTHVRRALAVLRSVLEEDR